MKLNATITLLGCTALGLCLAQAAEKAKPNVLWILTDDQRYDSIQAFNRILDGRDDSALGHVESPNVDQLAARGTTFINTYVHAQGCAPSRASMHYGRYPHHTGIYEFEYHNNKAPQCKPTLPEFMKELGYQTMHVGKLGVRLREVENGKAKDHRIYQTDISFKKMWMEGISDWTKGPRTEINGVEIPGGSVDGDWLFTPDGGCDFTAGGLNKIKGLEDHSRQIDEKYQLLRMYNQKKPKEFGEGEIIGGESPQPAGKTRDGNYANEFVRYLANPGAELKVGTQTYKGVNPKKPLFAHLGFDFPHTPVLPPKSFRDRFQKYTYDVPKLDPTENAGLPPQLKKLVVTNHSDHYTPEEKQQMVRDYYAFCAYGDTLVGQASDAFIAYSEKNQQPWMIVYVCGDHGWKLNEHGAISKFSPWKVDSLDPIIVVSSDKKTFPAGKVVKDFTEFVDIMPTILAAGGADLKAPTYDFLDGYDLAKVTSGELAPRQYVVGESHAVTGPRATLRTKDFMFSLKSRPDKTRGKDMEWALKASYQDLEPVLYNLSKDPDETHNLAFEKEYEHIAEAMKKKLLGIVIGDGRVEINWGPKGTGLDAVMLPCTPGADDKKIKF